MEESWNIGYAFLETNDVILQNFAAATFCLKINNEWENLNFEFQTALRTMLLTKLAHFSKGPPIILSQLSLAIARIAIFSIPTKWPTLFDDFLAFSKDEQMVFAFLEVMRILIEEWSRVSGQVKARTKEFMNVLTQRLVPILLDYLLIDNRDLESLKKSALKCLNPYIEHVPIELYERIVEANVLLLIHDVTTYGSTVVEILTNIMQSGKLFRYPKTLYKIIECTSRLIPLARELLERNDEHDIASLCHLFSVIGEYHSNFLIEHKEVSHSIISLLMAYTAYEDFSISALTFQFWYEFHEVCTNSLDPEVEEAYKPIFLQLIRTLEKQCAHPVIPMHEDDLYEFDSFRSECGDAILNCYNVLGEACLMTLSEDLKHFIEILPSQQENQYLYYRNLIEANLYLWKHITEAIGSQELAYVQRILELYPSFPKDSILLHDTSLRLLGDIAEHLKGNDALIMKVLSFILPCFQQSSLSSAVSHAFNELCMANPKTLVQHIHDIYTTVSPVLLNLSLLERVKVVRGMAYMGYHLPFGEAQAFLMTLLDPFVSRLMATINSEGFKNSDELIFVEDMEILTAACCDAEDSIEEHPFEGVFKAFFPCYMSAFNKSIGNVILVGQCCKYLMASLNILSRGLLEHVVEMAVPILSNGFCQGAHVDILKTYSTVLNILRRAYQNQAIPQDVITMVTKTFTMISEKMVVFASQSVNANNRMVIDPDLIKTYFDYVIRAMLTNIPQAFFNPYGCVENIVSFAVNLLAYVAESGSCKSVVYFIRSFYTLKNEDCLNMVDTIKEKLFGELLRIIMAGIGGATPQSLVRYMADLLAFLVKKYPESKTIMTSLMNQEDFPSRRVGIEKKKQFVAQLYLDHHKKMDMIVEFSDECRRSL